MTQWEYQVTIHQLPESKSVPEQTTIECDQNGVCFIHDASQAGIGWLQELLSERGKRGWELVQSGYHRRQLLCIWKKRKTSRRRA